MRRRNMGSPVKRNEPLQEHDDWDNEAATHLVVADQDVLLEEESESDDDSITLQQEHTHSIWSNTSFLMGSIFYVWIAIWDLLSPLHSKDSGDDDDGSLIGNFDWNWYDLVTAAGPFLYLVNAAIDLHYTFIRKGSIGTTRRWQLSATIIFGIAALMDMLGTLVFGSGNGALDYFPSAVAVHLYLLESILALCCGSYYEYDSSTANGLLLGGNVLFFMGSFIDVVISYLEVFQKDRVRRLEYWALLSASLWLLDAFLYISASVVDYHHKGNSANEIASPEDVESMDAFQSCYEELASDSQLHRDSPSSDALPRALHYA